MQFCQFFPLPSKQSFHNHKVDNISKIKYKEESLQPKNRVMV